MGGLQKFEQNVNWAQRVCKFCTSGNMNVVQVVFEHYPMWRSVVGHKVFEMRNIYNFDEFECICSKQTENYSFTSVVSCGNLDKKCVKLVIEDIDANSYQTCNN